MKLTQTILVWVSFIEFHCFILINIMLYVIQENEPTFYLMRGGKAQWMWGTEPRKVENHWIRWCSEFLTSQPRH